MILGSGTKGQDVRTMASEIAKLIADKKGKVTLEELSKVEGIGLANILGCRVYTINRYHP